MPLMSEEEFKKLNKVLQEEETKRERLATLKAVKKDAENGVMTKIGYIYELPKKYKEKYFNFIIDLINEEIEEIEKQ